MAMLYVLLWQFNFLFQDTDGDKRCYPVTKHKSKTKQNKTKQTKNTSETILSFIKKNINKISPSFTGDAKVTEERSTSEFEKEL